MVLENIEAQRARDIFSRNLKRYMTLKNKTQSDLAADLKITPSTISDWAKGKKYPRVDKMQMLADYFGVLKTDLTEEKLPSNAQTYTRGMPIPIVGTIWCGFNGLAYEDHDGFNYADVSNPKDYIFLKIKGNSMEPRIYEGDLALIHKQNDVDSGDLAAVIINGYEGTLKKVIKQDGAIILQAFNPQYPPEIISGSALDEFIIVGKVVKTESRW